MPKTIAIVGAGPAGLIAAERLARAGHRVTIHERMASPARKFLLAGRGGLNLTHSEPLDAFLPRYREAESWLAPTLDAFPPQTVRDWADGLGAQTFVGSSGRVFPRAMKTSPLLRAWLGRLAELGVALETGRLWTGWDESGALTFRLASGAVETARPDATLLALGGASWPRLGSDGGWVPLLAARGVEIAPLRPANVGFVTAWSPVLRERFAGQPLKRIAIHFGREAATGEAMVDAGGIEGGAIYALSASIREAISRDGAATIRIDLRPDLSQEALAQRLARRRKGETLSNHLRKAAGLAPVAVALLREAGPPPDEATALAMRIKDLPVTLTAPMPIARAISTAGGVARQTLDHRFMLKRLPGVFAAGEMLDWEAPTGGYLLQGCFATGLAAAAGIDAWLAGKG